MQVHSFDQLLDGLVIGIIGSSLLSDPKVLAYMKKLCD
jgi:hypothetical protein